MVSVSAVDSDVFIFCVSVVFFRTSFIVFLEHCVCVCVSVRVLAYVYVRLSVCRLVTISNPIITVSIQPEQPSSAIVRAV